MVKCHQHFVQRVVWSLLASYLQVQIYCRQLWGLLAEVREMYVEVIYTFCQNEVTYICRYLRRFYTYKKINSILFKWHHSSFINHRNRLNLKSAIQKGNQHCSPWNKNRNLIYLVTAPQYHLTLFLFCLPCMHVYHAQNTRIFKFSTNMAGAQTILRRFILKKNLR